MFTKCTFFFGLLVLGLVSNSMAQNFLTGIIQDAVTKKGIAHCNISNKGKTFSYITNEDGAFQLSLDKSQDVLVINSVGYILQEVTLRNGQNNVLIELQPYSLNTKVTNRANSNGAIDVLLKCRETILNTENQKAKVYYIQQSEINNQPVELDESFCNVDYTDAEIKSINYKNGRLACASYKNNLISNRRFLILLMNLHLTTNVESMPRCPFHLKKSELEKIYELELVNYNGSVPFYHIRFKAIKDPKFYFSGEVYINKKTYLLEHIELIAEETRKHPIQLNIYEPTKPLSFKIVKNYSAYTSQLNYVSVQAEKQKVTDSSDLAFNSKALLYFYEYDANFIEPDFYFLERKNDYHYILSQSFNGAFWKTHSRLPYSLHITKNFNYLRQHGALIGFSDSLYAKDKFLKNIFSNFFIPWDSLKRINVNKDNTDLNHFNNSFINEQVRSSLYGIGIGIYMDINEVNGELEVMTKTVFDTYATNFSYANNP